MTRPRSDWEAQVLSLGFTLWNAVKTKIKLLVAADPGPLSGKACKLRDYGFPIVDETGWKSRSGDPCVHPQLSD